MDQIPWWQSRTIWAALVSALAGVASMSGHAIDPALQGTIVDNIINAVSVISAFLAIYYRIKANATVITKANPVLPKGGEP